VRQDTTRRLSSNTVSTGVRMSPLIAADPASAREAREKTGRDACHQEPSPIGAGPLRILRRDVVAGQSRSCASLTVATLFNGYRRSIETSSWNSACPVKHFEPRNSRGCSRARLPNHHCRSRHPIEAVSLGLGDDGSAPVRCVLCGPPAGSISLAAQEFLASARDLVT
jgi:hypothetical protein